MEIRKHIIVKNYDPFCDPSGGGTKERSERDKEVQTSCCKINVTSMKYAVWNIINNYVSRGRYSFEKDYLLSSFNEGSININAYRYDGIVLRNQRQVLNLPKHNRFFVRHENQ